METKILIEWSYPTSPNAQKFGFKKGCYTVSSVKGNNPPKELIAFATKQEAENWVSKLQFPGSICSIDESYRKPNL